MLESEFNEDTTIRIWYTNEKCRSIPYVRRIKKSGNVLLINTFDNKEYLLNFDNINCVETE